MTVFAALALLLGATRIYGVSSCWVARQRHEIGIRMALGAKAGDIATLVYRGILLPSIRGLSAGAACAVWATRLLKALLFGVRAGDPKTLAAAALALFAIAGLAATGPALRACLTDPANVLRRE